MLATFPNSEQVAKFLIERGCFGSGKYVEDCLPFLNNYIWESSSSKYEAEARFLDAYTRIFTALLSSDGDHLFCLYVLDYVTKWGDMTLDALWFNSTLTTLLLRTDNPSLLGRVCLHPAVRSELKEPLREFLFTQLNHLEHEFGLAKIVLIKRVVQAALS